MAKAADKGIRLNGLDPEVVQLGKGITEDDLLFHDEKSSEPSLAYLLSRMRHEDGFPEPIGVFRSVDAPRYDVQINEQVEEAVKPTRRRRLGRAFQFRRNMDRGMSQICPYCGAEVIEGADVCDECQHSLTHLSIPIPATKVEEGLANDRLTSFVS